MMRIPIGRTRKILAAVAASVMIALLIGALAPAGTNGADRSTSLPAHPGIDNFGVVDEGVYRGAQPDSAGYETLREMGVKTVLNLRAQHDEQDVVEAAGMSHLEVPMGMVTGVSEQNVEKAVEYMSDPANRPIFVHCRLGQDRTGVVVALYRIRVDGWSLDDAESEMQSYGFNDMWINLKHLLRKMAGRDARSLHGPGSRSQEAMHDEKAR